MDVKRTLIYFSNYEHQKNKDMNANLTTMKITHHHSPCTLKKRQWKEETEEGRKEGTDAKGSTVWMKCSRIIIMRDWGGNNPLRVTISVREEGSFNRTHTHTHKNKNKNKNGATMNSNGGCLVCEGENGEGISCAACCICKRFWGKWTEFSRRRWRWWGDCATAGMPCWSGARRGLARCSRRRSTRSNSTRRRTHSGSAWGNPGSSGRNCCRSGWRRGDWVGIRSRGICRAGRGAVVSSWCRAPRIAGGDEIGRWLLEAAQFSTTLQSSEASPPEPYHRHWRIH